LGDNVKLDISLAALATLVEQHLLSESVGMLEVDVQEIRARIDGLGEPYQFDRLEITVTPKPVEAPAPVVRETKTGVGIRLASFEGRAV
jgi:hypothetical protein